MEIILFILLIVASIAYRIFRLKVKGYLGEKRVAAILAFLPSDKYKIINDVLIESNGKTIQIDHIVISIYGIFVIETKNYTGWITGSDNSEYWTKNMFGNKYKFYNPVKQNKAHILALNRQLGIRFNNFISIVVFTNNADLRINTTHNVIYISQIKSLIKEYIDIKFSESDVQKICEKVFLLNVLSSKARKRHITEVKSTIANKQSLLQQGICPRCGHNLVLRRGKYGKFFGCSNYPKCKFTKNLP